MIISIDFDGTIFEDNYPNVGNLKINAKETINKLYEDGNVILINTCRAGYEQGLAANSLKTFGIKHHYINQNCPTMEIGYNDSCRKLAADIYIDDKNMGGFCGWDNVLQELQKREDYGAKYHKSKNNAWLELHKLTNIHEDTKGVLKYVLEQYHDLLKRRSYLIGTYKYKGIHYLDIMAVTLLSQLKRMDNE